MINQRRKFIRTTTMATMLLASKPPIWAWPSGTPKWKTGASLPVRVQEIYCAVLNGRIHTAGGFIFSDYTSGVSNLHLTYDPLKDQWSSLKEIPSARHHLQLASFKGKLYGLGGFASAGPNSGWIMQAQTWSYDPVADQWTPRAPAPEPHGETVAAAIDNRIHIVGGRRPQGTSNAGWNDHTDTAGHLVYMPDEDRWTKAAPAPTARNSAAAAVINNLLYVAGGRTVAGGNKKTLEVYDPREDRWRKATPMPQAQGGLAAAAVRGRLYAFGGEYFDNGGGVFAQCWEYDPEKDEWTSGQDMLTPRHGLAGASIGDTIYAIAGAKKAGGNETSNILEHFTVVV